MIISPFKLARLQKSNGPGVAMRFYDIEGGKGAAQMVETVAAILNERSHGLIVAQIGVDALMVFDRAPRVTA